jgi:hypothetical protein
MAAFASQTSWYWEWEIDEGRWITLDGNVSGLLEGAYLEFCNNPARDEVKLVVKGEPLTFNFTRSTRYSDRTMEEGMIRRSQKSSSSSVEYIKISKAGSSFTIYGYIYYKIKYVVPYMLSLSLFSVLPDYICILISFNVHFGFVSLPKAYK